jgi:hypothetical protein
MAKRQKTAGRMRGEWHCVPLAEHPTTWIFLKGGANDREVLVGNLDANHTEADLTAAFGEFGPVER